MRAQGDEVATRGVENTHPKELNMSRTHRAAVLTALIVVIAFLLFSAPGAARADSDGATTTATKKAKASKSAHKKAAEKKAAAEKAEADKARAEKDYNEFDEDSSSTKPAEKAAEKSAEETAKAEEKPAAKKPAKILKTVVRFSLTGEYPEGPGEAGMFGDLQPSLGKLIERLDEAKSDKDVAAVWLRIEDLELGRGKVNEVRAAIARLRKAGKPVYAELTSADTGAYLVASACDQIFMPVSGVLIVPGVRMEVTFYKGLLDKLGLKFDALRMGKYKGFVEPMSRDSMSAPLRESLQSIVDDTYDDMIATIAKDRHLPDYQVKSLVDHGLFSATAAQEAGLIDEVLYADQFEASLGKRLKVGPRRRGDGLQEEAGRHRFLRHRRLRQADGSLLRRQEVGARAAASRRSPWSTPWARSSRARAAAACSAAAALGSTTMIETLKKAFADSKVVAVVLRIDSPGGSATASDLIWRETVRGKKPLVASMGNVAGSGGYYIAMGAKKIIAEPETITGSIGVGGGKLVTGGLYEKLGMNTEIISRGKNSGALSSTQPFTPDERRVWTKLLKETYHEFVSKAAEGRKMDYNRVEELAQGRVYTGRQAKKLGLIDEIGTLTDAVAEAKKLAGLKPDADVEIEILPQPKSLLRATLQRREAGDASEFTAALPDVVKIIRQTALWRQLLGEKVLLWMPYHVELK